MAHGRKKAKWRDGSAEKKPRHRVDRRLAREPDNEICIFMHGCRPKFCGSAFLSGKRGRSGTRRKTAYGHFKFIRRFWTGPWVNLAAIGGGRTIYRRFPARTPWFFIIIFSLVPLADQSVYGYEVLNGPGRIMALKFVRNYPGVQRVRGEKISIYPRVRETAPAIEE